ncbi:MAG: cellobiose phosphorylase, partial [Bacillota bacterium]|nr:cellobiose phosphorylase [Bacillota bacterium]
ALRQAIPVGYREVVPCGDFRQANCYYSSSDVTFRSRYEADELYDKIKTGEMTLKGGWRVYSSGPGIYIGLIFSKLLGLRVEFGNIIIDPVIPFSFNGLSASMNLMGHAVTFHFSVKDNCYSPDSISINGKPVHFTYEENKYREGGAIIPLERFLDMLDKKENIIDVFL